MAKNKPKSPARKALFALLLVVLFTGSAAFGVVASRTNLFRLRFEEDETSALRPSEFVDVLDNDPEEDFGDEQHIYEQIEDIRGVYTLSEILKAWATSGGELMSRRSVLNVLIIGADNRSTTEGLGNTDSMMLVSVDRKNKEIKLTSFFRDSYTYIDVYGGEYARINSALPNGGAKCLIDTIEKNYKIAIDYYAVVDFMTFVDVVDAIGGVTVPVQDYEADYIEYAYGFDCPRGEAVTLNGEQSLAYCRIRACDVDADVSRTRRQRDFISSLIGKTRELTLDDIGEIVDTVSKYVKTDCPMSTILSLAAKAVAGKWYDYPVTQLQAPDEETRWEYTGRGSSLIGNAWVFVVDYPLAAQKLQLAIYGETNIVLDDYRLTAIDAVNGWGGQYRDNYNAQTTETGPETEEAVEYTYAGSYEPEN